MPRPSKPVATEPDPFTDADAIIAERPTGDGDPVPALVLGTKAARRMPTPGPLGTRLPGETEAAHRERVERVCAAGRERRAAVRLARTEHDAVLTPTKLRP